MFPKNTNKKPESLAFSDQSFLETKDSADRKLAIRHGTGKNKKTEIPIKLPQAKNKKHEKDFSMKYYLYLDMCYTL